LKFNLKTVVLEGVDCSGKTTLFRSLHRATGFKWNIHDRSALSMLCYAVMYGRDVDHWRQLLLEEISDLNNVIVVLMPPLATIKDRLAERGDEFQDQETIEKLYTIFENEVMRLSAYPNVLLCGQSKASSDDIARWLLNYERQTYSRLAEMTHDHARIKLSGEAPFLKMTWEDTDFKTLSTKALFYEPELEYYEATRKKLIEKIQAELAGQNEYEMKQDLKSRRFVMTQDSCISYAHFMYRGGVLHANIVCRSSEVSRIFPNDIHFIGHMGQTARRELGLTVETPVRFNLTLDSAHVIFQPTH
jgi:hypothetical protein